MKMLPWQKKCPSRRTKSKRRWAVYWTSGRSVKSKSPVCIKCLETSEMKQTTFLSGNSMRRMNLWSFDLMGWEGEVGEGDHVMILVSPCCHSCLTKAGRPRILGPHWDGDTVLTKVPAKEHVASNPSWPFLQLKFKSATCKMKWVMKCVPTLSLPESLTCNSLNCKDVTLRQNCVIYLVNGATRCN